MNDLVLATAAAVIYLGGFFSLMGLGMEPYLAWLIAWLSTLGFVICEQARS